MRTAYYDQLRRHLEPESVSMQSKSKGSVPNAQQNISKVNGISKTKQDQYRNQKPQDSFGSFDGSNHN